MGSPAKRLRILRSVEVDETNSDYIEAKQKQQEKFKGTLEKLFAKYGDMHESMSDEIDFNTGKVVVDRGHLRRIQRQMKRKGPGLLDSLLAPELQQEYTPEEEEDHAESEDELAPTQTRKRKRDSLEDGEQTVQSSGRQKTAPITSPPQAASTAISQTNAPQVPNTPNPAANLFQQIQQTPLDQQAQAALFANLNQTIAQAVQQAVAPLLSILQNTPNGQAATALFSAPSPHLPATDSVRPAADPKWYFPPISAAKGAQPSDIYRSAPPRASEAQPQTKYCNEISSPIVARRSSPIVRVQRRQGAVKTHQSSRLPEPSVERPHSSHSLPALCPVVESKAASPSVHATPGRKSRRIRSFHKYHFTEEDNVYISKRRVLQNISFQAIKASKTKWAEWPLSAFHNHWKNCLKDKDLHLRNAAGQVPVAQHASATSIEHEEHFFSSIEIPETSSAEHRLPTPSSLEQEESYLERPVMPPSSHFDDDELELLSLAGADISDVLSRHASQHADDTYPTPDEPLPSIEGAEFRTEDEVQDELQREMLKLEESTTPEPVQPKALPSTIPETQESVVVISTPSQNRSSNTQLNSKSKPKPFPTYRAASDASDDIDLVGTNDEPMTPRIHIKREPSSPQATRVLSSSPAPKTPWTAPQSSGMAKSTGKLDRRAYLKEVKQGWAKAKGNTGTVQRRRSLNVLPAVRSRRRVQAEAGDSEDELAV
ncbi:uncharacterized protein M421DRAFT_416914 [Didymella exigua CBS 183.55]|uniref:Uncharacterized protein n=1 Tax=Didymella exigua CBS 183.55 TaxID=1150837 RepID=A0A6A5RX82_9PLEO|nr:uncharacterized protein M421DRAFT_416914 [Didymella exigua CBS 183.55]KAF1932183.1 hypothetical protein M421DRAFT_416914 [Didymella exigua CBS 183.55]